MHVVRFSSQGMLNCSFSVWIKSRELWQAQQLLFSGSGLQQNPLISVGCSRAHIPGVTMTGHLPAAMWYLLTCR